METVKIIADSTCDLSEELLERYDISVVPLNIVLDMESYCDKEEITVEELFKWSEANRRIPKTAAPTIEKAVSVIKPFVDEGRDIIFIGISEDMSVTCNVIRLMREELNYSRIFVINSMSLSTGIGLQILRAARLAQEGKSVDEIIAEIESTRSKVRASFVVDTMEYLAMGGRCSSVTALLASTLKIKPMIEVAYGKMCVAKKYRGNIDKVIIKYVQELTEKLKNAEPEIVFITHSPCSSEMVEKVREYLVGLNYFDEIVETNAGGTISCHCGPGTLGVLFYEK